MAAKEAGTGTLALNVLMNNQCAVEVGDQAAADLLRSGGPKVEDHVLGVVGATLSGRGVGGPRLPELLELPERLLAQLDQLG